MSLEDGNMFFHVFLRSKNATNWKILGCNNTFITSEVKRVGGLLVLVLQINLTTLTKKESASQLFQNHLL